MLYLYFTADEAVYRRVVPRVATVKLAFHYMIWKKKNKDALFPELWTIFLYSSHICVVLYHVYAHFCVNLFHLNSRRNVFKKHVIFIKTLIFIIFQFDIFIAVFLSKIYNYRR